MRVHPVARRVGENSGVESPTNEAAAEKTCQQIDEVDWRDSLEQCHADNGVPEERF